MRGLSAFPVCFAFITLAAVGCAVTTTTAAPPGTTAFTGEVWTWDEQDNTVTLRQGAQDIRVNVTPDTFIGLKLHEVRTIRGTLAPPKELATVTVQGQSTVRPRGAADEAEVTGTVAALDPAGTITVNTPQGPVKLWRATDGIAFAPGGTVRVRMRVQPMDVVLIQPGQPAATPAPVTIDPAASPRTEPGDYAVVLGRVLAVDPSGVLTVESSRGPVTVRVANATRYKVNDTVEVRTSVHPG